MTEPTGYTIEEITPDNIDEANTMRLESWLDTYTNEGLGITREWILERNKNQISDEARKKRLERLKSPKSIGWVAKASDGSIIGMATPRIDSGGTQHVGALYVDKKWHGLGVGSALMQMIIDWLDKSKPIELGVVTYNDRAKAFYRKCGFIEVPGSETLFENKIPEIKMIRPPEKF